MESLLLAALSDDDRRALLVTARRRRFSKGEVLFHEGDPGDTLHLVSRGHLAVRITTPGGDVAMVRILRPGEFFGELALLSPGPRNATVIALDKAETLGIAKSQLDELRTRRPALDAVVIEALAQEVRRLAAALVEALYLPSDKRVLRRLLDSSAALGADDAPARVVPLTQEELAQLAGVTRETANRTLKAAEEDGAVTMRRGRIEIVDLDALTRRAS